MAYDTSNVDRHVGAQIEARRSGMRLSRSDLSHMLDYSELEIAAWESGRLRVSASKLFQIARVLKVPVSYFFEPYLQDH